MSFGTRTRSTAFFTCISAEEVFTFSDPLTTASGRLGCLQDLPQIERGLSADHASAWNHTSPFREQERAVPLDGQAER